MPLDQPRRHNPLMLGYASELDMSDEVLSRRAGVGYSQVYMARTRHVGADNASKIARAVGRLLSLSYFEELELKAEIMGDPGNIAHAYLGNGKEIAERLGEEHSIGMALVRGKPLSNKAGQRVVQKLEQMNAPPDVLDAVRGTIKDPPSPPGRTTYTLRGRELREQRDRSWERLEAAKPHTHQGLTRSGLSRKDLYQRAGIGKETLRQALYESCGAKAAVSISEVLADTASLSRAEREAITSELQRDPQEILENSQKKSPTPR